MTSETPKVKQQDQVRDLILGGEPLEGL